MKFAKMLYCTTVLMFGCIMLSSACKLTIAGNKGKLVSNQRLEQRILKVEKTLTETIKSQEKILKKIMMAKTKTDPLPLDMCLEDVSMRKMTGQSSSQNYRKYPPRNGVDGNLSSMFHTRLEKNPYWWVDLGSSFSVHHVEIWNRGGRSYGNRLRELDVMVGPTLSKMKSCAYHKGRIAAGKHLILKCSKTTKGRYVKLGLRVKDILSLMEVKVFAYGTTCLNKT
ncbi:uncharacterized protein LOC127712633 [Mytilus californianus]|uniref:uncharacterized protein LOC127712633 n=1 Tax=Mytilus californianus TaxID=6549 RepID=UPI0022452045|nr:uncharacterized protein LOC127712633 [Mytilus californianus]